MMLPYEKREVYKSNPSKIQQPHKTTTSVDKTL